MNKKITTQLLGIMRQIVDRFCNSNRKLAFKFGQAGFLNFMVRDLKILKMNIKKSVDDGVGFVCLVLLIPHISILHISIPYTSILYN